MVDWIGIFFLLLLLLQEIPAADEYYFSFQQEVEGVLPPSTSGFAPSVAGLGRAAGDLSNSDGRPRPPDPASQAPVLGRRAEQHNRDHAKVRLRL